MRFTVVIFSFLCPLFLSAQQDTIIGDLDGDGLPEMAVLHHYSSQEDTLAELIVYRKGVKGIWKAARGPALYAWNEAGFSSLGVSIERRALVVVHFSDGYVNIEYIHRFRWQNDRFELIGTTYSQNGCTGGERFDYNLSTGDFEVEEWYDRCETENPDDESEEELPLKPYFSSKGRVLERQLITLDTFEPGAGVAKLPALGIRYF